MNHADGAHTDNPVPRTVSNLLVHVLGTHVDHVHDIVTRLEMELDSIELHLDKGRSWRLLSFMATNLKLLALLH
jgi:hypothetical protein